MTLSRAARPARGEDGVALILAMAFISLLGVLVVSLLSMTFSGTKTTVAVRDNNSSLYGADGGTDIAVQMLRANASYCPDAAAGTQSLPSQTIGGRTVTLACTTQSGTSGGGGSGVTWPTAWPFVLTGYNGAQSSSTFKTSGSTGQNITSTIQGPAFNAGGFSFAGGSDSFVFSGSLDEYDPYCTSVKPGSPGKPTVTGAWTCRNSGSFAVPDPNPTLKVPTAAAPSSVDQGSCRIFFPGKYTSDVTLNSSGKNYFASGVYYLENAKLQFVGEVFGGQPGPTDTKRFTGSTPCSTDAAAQALAPSAAINGYGVEFVAGGSTFFDVKNSSSTQVELYARVPGVPANEGTPYLSFYAPTTSGPNYLASTANTAITTGGSSYQMVVHGLFYMPNSRPKIWGVNNSAAGGAPVFGGGLVLADIELAINSTMATQTFAALPAVGPAPATDRTVVVTATATASSGGDAPQTVQAVVFYPADGSPPLIKSWRKT